MPEAQNRGTSLRGRLEDLFWSVLANAVTAGLAYLGLVLFGALTAEPVLMTIAVAALGLFVLAASIRWLPTFAYGLHLPHLIYGLVCLAVAVPAITALLRGFSFDGASAVLRLVLIAILAALGVNGLVQVAGSLAFRGRWIESDE